MPLSTSEALTLVGGMVAATAVMCLLVILVLHSLKGLRVAMATDLAPLTASVAANKSAIDSAVLLLQGLSAELKSAGTDPVALGNLQSALDAQTAALAAAVVANTPHADPAPVPPPAS